MEMALKSIPNLNFHQRIRDDDQVDQLHNYVTIYLLVISGLIVGVKELAGEPLDCWVTLGKSKHFQSHVNKYCWENQLYRYPDPTNLTVMPYPLDSTNTEDGDTMGQSMETINSYRWVTVVFIVQESDDELFWCFGKHRENKFLSTMYIVVKVCYLLNIFVQFLLLTVFLEFNFWNYGRHMTTEGIIMDYFPLTGLCHFTVKGQSDWIQCILVMNMLMEKIFLVQWLWFLVLLGVTVCNIMMWIPKIFRQEIAFTFVRRYLRVICKEADLGRIGRGTVRHFVCHYLGQDGVFLLRILAINTSTVAMAELMQCLWNRYQEDQTQAQQNFKQEKQQRHKMGKKVDDKEIEMEELMRNRSDDLTQSSNASPRSEDIADDQL